MSEREDEDGLKQDRRETVEHIVRGLRDRMRLAGVPDATIDSMQAGLQDLAAGWCERFYGSIKDVLFQALMQQGMAILRAANEVIGPRYVIEVKVVDKVERAVAQQQQAAAPQAGPRRVPPT